MNKQVEEAGKAFGLYLLLTTGEFEDFRMDCEPLTPEQAMFIVEAISGEAAVQTAIQILQKKTKKTC